MRAPPNKRAAPDISGNGSLETNRLAGAIGEKAYNEQHAARQRLVRFAAKRSARRQRQAYHLQQCGARAVLEALLSVESGEPLEAVLSDFCRLPPATYHAVVMLYCDEVAG